MRCFSIGRRKPLRLFTEVAGLIAVVAIALIVRFHGITVPAIWYDEAFSLLLARETPWQIWSITVRDIHPPLYYVLLHYWTMLFGDSVLAARSLSVLADMGTLLLGMKLMSLVATQRATWIFALLFALLPMSVRYSQEVRMYTLLCFWLMGATVALVCWVKAPEQKRFPLIYVLLMTAACYTHYFAALCVLVHWQFWWWGRRVDRSMVIPVRWWMGANSAIVLLFLPWLPHLVHQLSGLGGFEWIPPVTWQTVLTIVWQFTVMNDQVAESSLWRVVPLALILVCAVTVVLRDRSERRYGGLLVGYFFIPTIALFLAALIVPVFVPRYLVFAAVGLPMIAAVALDSWGLRRIMLATAVLVLFVIGEIQGLLSVYRQMDGLNGTDLRKDSRLDAVAAEIAWEARPDDEIVLDSLLWYLPFMYYNTTGTQPRFYVRSSIDAFLSHSDRGGYALIPNRLKWIYFEDVAVLRGHSRRVWWITALPPSEDRALFAKDWKQTLTVKRGEVEARLFILDSAPTFP